MTDAAGEAPEPTTPQAGGEAPPALPPLLTDEDIDRAFAAEFGTTLPPGDPVRPFLRATEAIYRRYLEATRDMQARFAADLERYRRQDGPITWLFVVMVILQLAQIAFLALGYYRP